MHEKVTKNCYCSILQCLCLIFCLSVMSCANKTSKDKNVFHLNLSSGNLESLDPAFAKDLYMMWVTHMIYNTLVETDAQLHTVPSLAKRWTVSDDGLVYTFYLRNDVYFQDNPQFAGGRGRLLTANDVVYSFSRLINKNTASPGAWIFNDRVAKSEPFKAIDDTTVQITLRMPFRPLPQLLSMAYCNIVPHEVADHWGRDFRSHPCGTGPFTFGYWDEGNMLTLKRNERYWEKDSAGKKLPYLDAVQVSFTDSKATEFLLFLQGRLDFVNGIDGSFKDLILSKNGEVKKEFTNKFHLERSTYLNTEYLGFLTDTTNPLLTNAPTGNPLIRRAINYAVNRKKIVTYFKNGMGTPANNGFIPKGMPGYDDDHPYGYNYDPKKAEQLLAMAGHPNGKGLPPVTILVQDNYVDIVNFVASELQDIGLKIKLEVIQPNILRQQMSESKAVFFRAQWIADYPDAETYMAFFNGRLPAPPNYTRFKDVTFDRWYNESLNLPDSARWRLYRKMDSLAMSHAPVVPLYYDEQLHFTSNRITGLRSNPMNIIDIKRVRMQ